MKITFVTATLTSGGSERVMSLLANELSARGHSVSIILLKEPLIFYSIDKNVKLYFAENYSKITLKKIYWLRTLIKKEKPDVVIPFMTGVYCTTIASLLGVNIPIISSERIDPRYSSRLRSVLRWALLRFTTHLVVQTQDIKNFYSKSIQKKTSIIPNPVSEAVFNVDTNIKKQKQIISVGRLYEQKNQKLMIDAFGDIASKHADYKLVIYGEGPLRQELTDYIISKNLTNRVLLPGRSESVITELLKSEIFCLSSDYEGMSNALLEALCVGLPIVTTRVSGVDDLLIDKENALITEVKDRVTFARSLDILISNDQLREKFAINNKKQATQYKLCNIVNKWEELINSIVSND